MDKPKDFYNIEYKRLDFNTTEKYLNRHTKYYFHCRHGVKSKEVVMSLTEKGYNVTQII